MAVSAAAFGHLGSELVAMIALVAVLTSMVFDAEVESGPLLPVAAGARHGEVTFLEWECRCRVLLYIEGSRVEPRLLMALATLPVVPIGERSVMLVVMAVPAPAELQIPPPVFPTKFGEMTLVAIRLGMQAAEREVGELVGLERDLPGEPSPADGAVTTLAVPAELCFVNDPVAACALRPLARWGSEPNVVATVAGRVCMAALEGLTRVIPA
jgi:hypothetical protein